MGPTGQRHGVPLLTVAIGYMYSVYALLRYLVRVRIEISSRTEIRPEWKLKDEHARSQA